MFPTKISVGRKSQQCSQCRPVASVVSPASVKRSSLSDEPSEQGEVAPGPTCLQCCSCCSQQSMPMPATRSKARDASETWRSRVPTPCDLTLCSLQIIAGSLPFSQFDAHLFWAGSDPVSASRHSLLARCAERCRAQEVPCVLFPAPRAKKIFVYAHGNCEDMWNSHQLFMLLRTSLNGNALPLHSLHLCRQYTY